MPRPPWRFGGLRGGRGHLNHLRCLCFLLCLLRRFLLLLDDFFVFVVRALNGGRRADHLEVAVDGFAEVDFRKDALVGLCELEEEADRLLDVDEAAHLLRLRERADVFDLDFFACECLR